MDHKRKAIDLFLTLDRIEDSRFEIQIGKYLQVIVVRDLLCRFAEGRHNHGLYQIQAHGLLEWLDAAVDHDPNPPFLQGLLPVG